MKFKFTKMHGLGNDYIYVNCFDENIPNPEKVSEIVSDRHFSIGGDGLVLIMPSSVCDFRMRMFNADGSEGKMCGNAIRCIGKYVYDRGLTDKTTVTIETASGIKTLTLFVKDGIVETVRVDMGSPVLKAKLIPVISNEETFINKKYIVDGKEVRATAVSMGNPHSIIFTQDIDNMDLEKIGPSFENHTIFPERVNTEFVEVLGENEVKMRVWERGSGETMACGTGACAVAVASCLNGFAKRGQNVLVHLRGGDLNIVWTDDNRVLMTGPAQFAFDGEVTLNI
jgi:diaminopimelate epimerase